jgi:hypothetical protein
LPNRSTAFPMEHRSGCGSSADFRLWHFATGTRRTLLDQFDVSRLIARSTAGPVIHERTFGAGSDDQCRAPGCSLLLEEVRSLFKHAGSRRNHGSPPLEAFSTEATPQRTVLQSKDKQDGPGALVAEFRSVSIDYVGTESCACWPVWSQCRRRRGSDVRVASARCLPLLSLVGRQPEPAKRSARATRRAQQPASLH